MTWKRMYSCMGIYTMYLDTDTGDIIYLHRRNKWVVYYHTDKEGTKELFKHERKEKAIQYIEGYIGE